MVQAKLHEAYKNGMHEKRGCNELQDSELKF